MTHWAKEAESGTSSCLPQSSNSAQEKSSWAEPFGITQTHIEKHTTSADIRVLKHSRREFIHLFKRWVTAGINLLSDPFLSTCKNKEVLVGKIANDFWARNLYLKGTLPWWQKNTCLNFSVDFIVNAKAVATCYYRNIKTTWCIKNLELGNQIHN